MKNEIKKLWLEIVNILDAYHYYNEEEVAENERLFTEAIINKDVEYINEVIALFDDSIEEEKVIIDTLQELMNK